MLAREATEEKSNAITATLELPAGRELKGVILTLDGLGCQPAIVSRLVAQGGR